MEEVYGSMALKTEKHYTYEDLLALPEDVRAELIDGQIYYMSAPTMTHQLILTELMVAFHTYISSHKGRCKVFPAPFGVFLDEKTSTFLEPDIVIICDRNRISKRGCEGAPDLVVEVLSPSTRSKDIVLKSYKYQENGVREYWMVDPDKERVTVLNFEKDTDAEYSFSDTIPVGIYEDFSIDFSQLDLSIS